MADALLLYLRHTLPEEIRVALTERLVDLEQGNFEKLLSHQLARQLFGHEVINSTDEPRFDASTGDWNDYVFGRLEQLLVKRTDVGGTIEENPLYRQYFFLLLAVAAVQAFIQSNVTGPPLPFSSSQSLFPESVAADPQSAASVRNRLLKSLGVDGEAAYKLTPNIELICLADTILICPPVKKNVQAAEWANLRKDFIHQRLLSEVSPTLQTSIYEALDAVRDLIDQYRGTPMFDDLYPPFLLEEVSVHVHHGLDARAREILSEAAKERGFQFALTGRLGKRTKFQENEISQLVVLAKSRSITGEEDVSGSADDSTKQDILFTTKPENLDLNDDTLLEAISFSKTHENSVGVVDETALTPALATLDAGNQPLLHPLDSTILLLLASAITNTSPTDGLTREETLPYATRVLEGGSSNWQVYTQALLVRSRIEGYRSRTTERGLLQLQALVDQVIAETTSRSLEASLTDRQPTTFLPRVKEAESASVQERLQYIYPLCSPTRWELEAELAARWVSLGGLRSALEIYERLEMWAEAALCWAAVEREDKARKIVRRQLFHATHGADEDADLDEEKWEGAERDPAPADAPRLYCILGDFNSDLAMWEKAWDVSNSRYARAQRSLGRHYFSSNNHVKAADSYAKALKVNQLNGTSWFALGCCLLELGEFSRATEAFSRTVQLDDSDAEAWSNLAAALLRQDSASTESEPAPPPVHALDGDEESLESRPHDPQQHRKDALTALKRAATLKHDQSRIWDNLLTVAASLSPPSHTDVVVAMTRLVEIRGAAEGEKCVDVGILEHLVRWVVAGPTAGDGEGEVRGVPRMVCELVEGKVVPLITTSARLWRVVATLALWRGRAGEALAAQEKAWRAVTAVVGWEAGSQEQWAGVVEGTLDLVDAYESLGERLGKGGEMVAKDWRFKSRSALRGVMGKGKENFLDGDGMDKLKERLDGLKAVV